ncbi:unnamed protein product, partial [marine sediment metagenome]
MQQTLALLYAYANNKRVGLKASESGILLVGEPVIKDIVNLTSNSDTGLAQGTNIPCSQVMIMGHPDNTGNVWIRPY